jgi:NADH-quinone oxidoreductase subunit L
MKAMIVNRVGDIGVTLAIFTIFYVFNLIDFATVFSLVPTYQDLYFSFIFVDVHALTLIGILLLIGAVGKSAQLGLHT